MPSRTPQLHAVMLLASVACTMPNGSWDSPSDTTQTSNSTGGPTNSTTFVGLVGGGTTLGPTDSSSTTNPGTSNSDGGHGSDTADIPEDAYFIAPNGDDANPGSADSPWKTWQYALAQLRPGNTLVAYPGEYGEATQTGVIYVDCSPNATACDGAPCYNGLVDYPVTIRALEERKSSIHGEGSVIEAAVLVRGCSHWTLSGFDVVGYDDPLGLHQYPIWVDASSHITVRRMVAREPNRNTAHSAIRVTDAVSVSGDSGIVFEENEVYDYTGIAFRLLSSPGVTLRRNYANPRGRRDPTGMAPQPYGFFVSDSPGTVIENNIVEDVEFGLWLDESAGSDIVAGNLFRNHRWGYYAARLSAPSRLENNVALETERGFQLDGSAGTVAILDRNTSIDHSWAGYAINSTSAPFDGATVRGCLASTGQVAFGYTVYGADTTSPLSSCNAWGPDTSADYDPAELQGADSVEIDPLLGNCLVYIPDMSPLKHAGLRGDDIGASVIWRLEHGMPTSEKLWDQTTGAFTCGSVVAGVSDGANACANAHERFHVGTFGCPIP